MRSRIPTLVLGATAAALVAASCATQGGQAEGWAGAPTAELAPTGMILTGTSDSSQTGWSVVADGTGAVWTRGPWQLTRVDPATGDLFGDYHLTVGSTARNVGLGTVLTTVADTLRDIDYERRATALPVDIGADEFGAVP